jgi:RNA polymerase sigma factor (sigma-70 family)
MGGNPVATARFRREPDGTDDDRDARVAAVVRHLPALQRVARRVSLCADDAQDAVQRALEIYVRRLDSVEPATEVAWLKVVVRHEALAIRHARQESVAGEEVDFDAHAAPGQRGIEDEVAGSERVVRSAEALRTLKRDEATALLLKAQGHSYAEIGALQGWTYTKVNRAITEGRKRFLEAYAEIESGEGCERMAPLLLSLAAGTAQSAEVVALRAHLRHCVACRARVRDLHRARRPLAPAWWLPVSALAAPLRWLRDRLPGGADEPGHRLQHALHRLSGSEVATGVQLAAGSGGGRGMGVAALIGVCLSGAGAGTYCAVTGGLPGRAAIVRPAGDDDREPERRRAVRPRATTPAAAAGTHAEVPPRAAGPDAAATPTPTVTPQPQRTGTPPARASGATGAATTSATTRPTPSEFGFEAAGGTPASAGTTTASTGRPTARAAARSSSSAEAATAPDRPAPATGEFGFE